MSRRVSEIMESQQRRKKLIDEARAAKEESRLWLEFYLNKKNFPEEIRSDELGDLTRYQSSTLHTILTDNGYIRVPNPNSKDGRYFTTTHTYNIYRKVGVDDKSLMLKWFDEVLEKMGNPVEFMACVFYQAAVSNTEEKPRVIANSIQTQALLRGYKKIMNPDVISGKWLVGKTYSNKYRKIRL